MVLIDGFDAWTAACLVFILAILFATMPNGNPAAGGALLFGPAQIILTPMNWLGGLAGWGAALAVLAFLLYLSLLNGFVGEAALGVAILSIVAYLTL